MFIFWGTEVKKNKLGVVADYCPKCQTVVKCSLTEYSTYEHIYLIPIGKKRQTFGIECSSCLTNFETDRKHYDQVLSISSANQLTDKQLLRVTNPLLVRRLEEIDANLKTKLIPEPEKRLEEINPDPQPEKPKEQDIRVTEALKALNNIPNPSPKIRAYIDEVKRWHQLGPVAQEQLLQSINSEIVVQKYTSVANKVAALALPFRPKIWLLIPLGMVLAAVVVGIISLLADLNPKIARREVDFVMLNVLGMGAVVGILFCFHLYRLRVWVRKEVIPLIDQAGVDVYSFKEFLWYSNRHNPPFTPEGKQLVVDALRIGVVLRSLNRKS